MALYNFTDPWKLPQANSYLAEAFTINGDRIEDLIDGYKTLYVKGRESMSADVELFDNGRANGNAFNYKKYPERVITIGYQIKAEDAAAFREAYNQLAELLNVEQAQFIFDDEPDKFFIGTPAEMGEVEAGRNTVTGEFNIICADPFKYSVTEYSKEISVDSPETVQYNGTVPAFPRIVANNTGGALWFESYQINDNLLVISDGNNGMTKIGNMSEFETTTESGWTVNTATTAGSLDDFQILGKIRYQPTDVSNIFRLDVYGEMGDAGLSPRIRLYRNYVDGIPLTEVQFMVGSDVVYRETIDDDNADNRFPFRISFSHTPVLQSTRLGRMTGNYFFQFREITFECRKSWAFSVSTDASVYTISGAKFAAASYYMDDMCSNWDRSWITLYNASLGNAGSVFPESDATIVKPATKEIYVGELPCPFWGNHANRWDDFKLTKGDNTLNCNGFGAGRSSLKVKFYWREVFL